MNSKFKIAAAPVVLAITILGCSQVPGGPTGTDASPSPLAMSPSEAPSVAANGHPAAAPPPPVEFTGRIECGPPVRQGTEETLDVGDEGMVVSRSRGGAWQQTVSMSDPRLEGAVYHTFEADEYRAAGAESGVMVWAATLRIVNETGAWENRGYGGTYSDSTPIGDNSPEVWIGEGAYEGLVAIVESTPIEGTCDADVRGIIFDGAPVPEPYIPE